MDAMYWYISDNVIIFQIFITWSRIVRSMQLADDTRLLELNM